MKRYTALFCNEIDGKKEYNEIDLFANTSKEIKSIDGFRSIVSSENVTHPSPEIMQRALISMSVNVAEFYKCCDSIKKYFDEEEEKLILAGDEGALKRREAREKREREAEAKRAKKAKKKK